MNLLSKIINLLNENFPKLVQLIEANINLSFLSLIKPINHRFLKIYRKNLWGSKESVSGVGSILDQTKEIRKELPLLLDSLNAKSILDIPSGDFNWMSKTDLKVANYIGGDIVPEIIENNKKRYESNGRRFQVMDITKDRLPKVDVILCRDCLVHLSYKDIFSALKNIKLSNSTYLLTTTFINRNKNRNIFSGGWRPLNLTIPPFNFPKPIRNINEKCTEAEGRCADKSLGLWRINDIKLRQNF